VAGAEGFVRRCRAAFAGAGEFPRCRGQQKRRRAAWPGSPSSTCRRASLSMEPPSSRAAANPPIDKPSCRWAKDSATFGGAANQASLSSADVPAFPVIHNASHAGFEIHFNRSKRTSGGHRRWLGVSHALGPGPRSLMVQALQSTRPFSGTPRVSMTLQRRGSCSAVLPWSVMPQPTRALTWVSAWPRQDATRRRSPNICAILMTSMSRQKRTTMNVSLSETSS
jgi:hypothetical protein